MDKSDLILLHPPSIYDFRKCTDIIFPDICNTVIPASPMFEILPLGFYNIKTYLEARNISVKIYNIAHMMLKDWDFDVESFLFTLRPTVFGIDLYWLVHAHGALELAKVLKRIHRDIPILFGGMSASYFYKELITYPFVDFIIRGNMTLSPIEKLVKHIIKKNRDYSKIPNLCYKKDGKAIINSFKKYTQRHFYPINWNIKGAQAKNINNIIINYTSGCQYNCCFCGGSKYSTKRYGLQSNALLYKPRIQIFKEIDSMKALESVNSKRKRLKILTINNMYDEKTLNTLILDKLKKTNLFSTIYLYIYDLIPIETVKNITKYFNPVFEISPQLHDSVSRKFCHCADYSNEEFEAWAEKILKLKVKRIEVYFMIGLPGQTEDSVFKTVEYCETLLERFKDSKKLIPLLSPMLPFLDPGSLAFDKAEQYGYRILLKTLEEHRKASTSISFRDRLNYETEWMSRSQIIDVSLKALKMLTQAKIRYGYLTPAIGKAMISRIDYTYQMINTLDKINSIKNRNKRLSAFKKIERQICLYNKEVLNVRFWSQAPMVPSLYNYWYEI